MTEKAPSMPFYGKQFYDDEIVWLSSLAHQGLYVALLWNQWASGSIPSDVSTIARLVGQREADVRKVWTDVSRFFESSSIEGRLINPQLEIIRANMVKLREGRSKAGSKGGTNAQANRQTNLQANLKHSIGEGIGTSFLFGEEGCGEEIAAAAFGECWSAYPRKLGKDAARRHFDAQVHSQADLSALQSAIRNYRREIDLLAVEERYVLHGSTFFNGRWKDYVDGVWAPPKTGSKGGPRFTPAPHKPE